MNKEQKTDAILHLFFELDDIMEYYKVKKLQERKSEIKKRKGR